MQFQLTIFHPETPPITRASNSQSFIFNLSNKKGSSKIWFIWCVASARRQSRPGEPPFSDIMAFCLQQSVKIDGSPKDEKWHSHMAHQRVINTDLNALSRHLICSGPLI
jgi:hypothetical protein